MNADEDNDGQGVKPPPKKRGRYRRYFIDPSVPIPRSTTRSRAQRAQQRPPSPTNSENVDVQRDDMAHQENVMHETHDNQFIAEDIQEIVNLGDEEVSAEQEGSLNEEHTNLCDNSITFEKSQPDVHVDSGSQEKSKPKKTFAEKHHLHEKLHQDFPVTKMEALLMTLHLAVRHAHTQHFIEDLIKFVNILFGSNVLDVSYYIFSTLFQTSSNFVKQYFCDDCNIYLGSETDFLKMECPHCTGSEVSVTDATVSVVCHKCNCYLGSIETFLEQGTDDSVCPQCSADLNLDANLGSDKFVVCLKCKLYLGSSETKFLKRVRESKCTHCQKQIDVASARSKNYFITFPLKEQIIELLAKPSIKLVSRSGRDPNFISDIFDGEIYRKLSEPGGYLAHNNSLTLTLGTDGVAVQKSTSDSLWAIQAYVNEVVPEQRFKTDNLLLLGLHFGKAPNMSVFFKPFMKEILDLSVNGFKYQKEDSLIVEQWNVYPLAVSVDSVAKPKLVCQKQFNGQCGCYYCYHPNDTIVEGNNKQKYYDQFVNFPLRTDEDIIRDMLQADKLHRAGTLKNSSVNGFLGISILTEFTKLNTPQSSSTFHLLWGVVIDYMHAALEWVASDLFNIFENILSSENLKILDEFVKCITPSQGLTRRPRSFSLRSYWKAKEYRAVLLYYALPCLKELLPTKNFNNLKHFVNALFILLSDNISKAQLSEAAKSLSKFTIGYQKLYGLQNVSYNLHICRHLVDMVIQLGPLWCYSNFLFESGNGYLARLIKGTAGIIHEIANKHSCILSASKIISQNTVSHEALEFCDNVINSNRSSFRMEIDNVLTTDIESLGDVSAEDGALLQDNNVEVSNGKVLFFKRIVKHGVVFCSKSYTKSKVYNDSCVLLRDQSFAVIDKIVKSASNQLLAIIKPINISQGSDIIPSIKMCAHFPFADASKVVLFSDVVRKCNFITVKDQSYICLVPNTYERD